MRISKVEREAAIGRLRGMVKPGDTLHCILRHTSRSGMMRVIQVYKLPRKGEALALGYNAAIALRWTFDRKHDGVKVAGFGMDMGFHLVYSIGVTLFPKYKGENGEYALKHRWL